MLKATALNKIVKNGKIVGYRLRDTNGQEMDVQVQPIIAAMKAGKIEFDNLVIKDNTLVMIEKTVENKKTTVDNNTETDPIKRIQYLVKVLNHARMVYEQGKDEEMSNFEYDKMYDELEKLEKENNYILPNSPTQNIGYEVVSALPKETHPEKMMSLGKTKDLEEIVAFAGNHDVAIGWKLDGLTVVVTYEGGKLVKAVTRGNGEVGELVTPNAKQFINLPQRIPFDGKLVVRGEATITYSDFEKINARLADDEKYKNPRNLASGSVRQLDSRITAQRRVRFTAFSLVEMIDTQGKKANLPLVSDTYREMQRLGLDVVESTVARGQDILKVIAERTARVQNKKLDQPVDGLVITYNDIAYGKSLGSTAKSPRHSIALKWEDECVETRIRDIEWSASKTGLLNPVAIFDPVDIEGSTVSRASVHNVSIFASLELGYGDRVTVYKANMIIPQILDNLDRTSTCVIPDTCPVCGGPTEIHEDPSSGVYTLYCINDDCPAKGNRLLKHFVSRDAMNIEGISGATLEKLGEFGIIDSFSSVFRLNRHPEIINIEGFGLASYSNMLNAIDKARTVKLHNLIYALSIPNVGLQTAKVICKHFNNDLKKTVTADYLTLASIPGIGDVIASNFYNYFHNKENIDEFIDLLKELNVVQEEVKQADKNDNMFGKTFCVTGKVNIFPNRDAIKTIIESRGGKLTGSVSKSTDFLVTNDTGSGSRKNKAAAEYGIPILSEIDFIKMFNITV